MTSTRKPGLLERFIDFATGFLRRSREAKLEKLKALLIAELDSECMDKILELLLCGMSLMFFIDREFRANIRRFKARYAFTSQDKGISASAVFKTSWLFGYPKMIVYTKAVSKSNVAVEFKDGQSLAKLLLSPRPDIFAGILDNNLSLNGNLNYILKFAYMARHLPARLGITVPEFA
jgi:hypothetical protein